MLCSPQNFGILVFLRTSSKNALKYWAWNILPNWLGV